MTEPELAPCPFCGCSNVVLMDGENQQVGLYCVECFDCEACGPLAQTEEEAARHWNQRTAGPKHRTWIAKFQDGIIWWEPAPASEPRP